MSGLLEELRGQPTLVVGLGRSGCAAARRLLAAGAEVAATDRLPLDQLPREAQALVAAGVQMSCGGHDIRLFTRARWVVVSPGVALDLPAVAAARRAGAHLCTEIDLVADQVDERLIAVTGSNGKSTTTALIGAMLAAAGREGVVCANFGVPLCDAVHGDHPGRWYAAELSSFQLDVITRLAARAVVLLNIQPDHLDRHGAFAAYRAAKERIVALRRPAAPAVLAVDDPTVAALVSRVKPPVLEVSAEREVRAGGAVTGGRLVLRVGGAEEPLVAAAELPLAGRHNRINVLAAATACRAVGVGIEALRRAALAFRPLAHRLQEAAQVRGVRFVDDSKATNVAAVLEGVAAVAETLTPSQRMFVLLGGRDKGSDFRPLATALPAARAAAVVFGEAGPLIAQVLTENGFTNVERVATLEDAVELAHAQARPGDVVLLSPACASFDAFSGYAARGDAFAAAARRRAEEGR